MIGLLVIAGWTAVLILVMALCQASGRADRAMSKHLTLVRDDTPSPQPPFVPAPTPSPRGVGQPAGALTLRSLIG